MIVKNYDKIEFRKQKIIDELKLINNKPDDILGICSRKAKLDNKTIPLVKEKPFSELKRLKKWQFKIIQFLEKATPEKIHTTLEIEKGKLCPKCEGGLHTQEIRCDEDFKQFVFCDMMNQSIKVTN